jgi:microcin C transport system permease protein
MKAAASSRGIRRRRWERFKKNRRSWVSLWIFGALFAISLLSEFVANDKPILARYEGKLYFPLVKN